MRIFAFVALLTLVNAALPPFSWSQTPVFAFPGAAPRFMTSTEEAYYVANFSNVLIWGLNATCVDNGVLRPASCPSGDSHCWCNKTNPEAQTWVLNMESSLQAQGNRLHAEAARQGKANYFVLGYIEYLSIQQYYRAQMELVTNAAWNSTALLRIDNKGLIDCYTDGCNWQGVEFRQYDLRIPAVQVSAHGKPHTARALIPAVDLSENLLPLARIIT